MDLLIASVISIWLVLLLVVFGLFCAVRVVSCDRDFLSSFGCFWFGTLTGRRYQETASILRREIHGFWWRGGDVPLRLVGIVVRARTLSFAATRMNGFLRFLFDVFISPNMVVVVGTCSSLQQRLKTPEGSTWTFHRSRCVVSSSKKHGCHVLLTSFTIAVPVNSRPRTTSECV